MPLKEFDLDLIFFVNEDEIKIIMEEKKYDYYEASCFLYEKKWGSKRFSFSLETRCITSYFERLFKDKKYKINGFWKFLIECVENISDERVINIEGVVSVQIEFNYKFYIMQSSYQKRIIILNTLMEGIKKITDYLNISIDPFLGIQNEIIESDYINSYSWKKPIKNPDKQYEGEIFLEHNMEEIIFYLLIKDKNKKLILKEKILTEKPDEWFYKKHLGLLRWKSNNEIELLNQNDEIIFCQKI